ncbi:hypothetical protein EW146_g8227 [Bondarzewia mesenterica]|uniref:Uncharacterized protein n=1 Tax=Bondarzewia mesenterica TaxID=1095465 RepID=A0A4V3XDT0_9AGAM|nr:hypothetical protein EW146_g8227 [Bondarzewia mesenterica]
MPWSESTRIVISMELRYTVQFAMYSTEIQVYAQTLSADGGTDSNRGRRRHSFTISVGGDESFKFNQTAASFNYPPFLKGPLYGHNIRCNILVQCWTTALAAVRAARCHWNNLSMNETGQRLLIHLITPPAVVELSPFLASSASIEQDRQVKSTTCNELDIDRAVSGVPACRFRLRTECGSASFPNGIFTCLICCSTYLLFRKGLQSRANVVLLIATLTMFGASSSQWGTQFAVVVKQIQGILIREPDQTLESKYPTVNETTLKLSFVDQYLSSINFLVGDSIVIWRVWILYDGKRKVMIVPIIPLIIATVTTFLVGGLQSRVFSTNVEDPNDIYNVLAFWFQVATYGLELATNLAATSLIAYKAWKHRKLIKSALGPRKKTKVEKVLALLVESGVLYCILWILLIGFEFVPPGIANYFTPTAAHIAGMYPTVIVILVSIDQTAWEMTGILVADSVHQGHNLSMLDLAHPRFSLPIEVSRQERSSGSVLQLGSVQVQSAGRDVQLTTVNENLKAASFIF